MDTIEGVIETYEMRTGNSASASAARQALAELKAESEERQRIYICACNVNTQLRTELDEARKVIEQIAQPYLYSNETGQYGGDAIHYRHIANDWLASHPKDGEK